MLNETLEKKKRFIVAREQINKKIPNPRNANEHYQSFIGKKNTKSVKQSKIITYQPKTFENPSIVDTKSVITEHPKPSYKLSKTTRQAEKVGSNSSLYSDAKTITTSNMFSISVSIRLIWILLSIIYRH